MLLNFELSLEFELGIVSIGFVNFAFIVTVCAIRFVLNKQSVYRDEAEMK